MKVIVVGGGVIGYSVAHALASRGADVHVIDMRGVGRGATRASAGMLAPYIEAHDELFLGLAVRSLSLFDEFIARLTTDAGQDIEYRRTGTIQAAWTAAHAAELSRASADLEARGVAHSFLTGTQVQALEPDLAPGIVCGLHVPEHGYLRVDMLMSALTRAAERFGVTSSVDRVTAVNSVTGGVSVRTDVADYETQAVVVAAGSWSGQVVLRGSEPLPVKPVRGQSLELRLDRPCLAHVLWSDGCYLVPWTNNSIIVGATVEDVGFDESSTAEGLAMLLRQARAALPPLTTADVREIRVGLRPASADGLPLVGWSSTTPGVYVATGHYRNGILLAPLTAKLAADAIFGVRAPEMESARELLSPSRLSLQ